MASELIIPNSYASVQTLARAVGTTNGTRTMAILGEGYRTERIVVSANGSGKDGLNSTYTNSISGTNGRRFQLGQFPIVSNRTTLFKNGIPLTGLEGSIINTTTTFSNLFDYLLDIESGRILLQGAALVDQGGSFYKASTLNIGTGTIDNLSLIDSNAPSESWTIRCVSVLRDAYSSPIDGYAKFIATGSSSGTILDGYGQTIVWQSNGVIVDNGILRFSISEGLTAFHESDKFTIKVKGGALLRGDTLTATYIPFGDLNDPEFFTTLNDLTVKHGQPSLTNRLSLGAQIAFANGPPGTWAVETAPAIPRRISYTLVTSANGTATIDDLTFPLPINVVPDANTNINFFLTDPVTGIESQILPNKFVFYDPIITATPSSFIFGSHVFSYTVVLEDSVQKSAEDGVITPTSSTTGTLSSATVTFDLSDLSATRSVQIFDDINANNDGIFAIISVVNGQINLSNPSGFTANTNVRFRVLDSSITSARILFTQDLALSLGQSLRAAVVDTKDASFFDVNWETAYQALEKIETQMVVPLPSQTITAIFQEGVNHVTTMSSLKNRKERVLFIGAINGLTPDNISGFADAAVEDIGILEGIQGDTVAEILAGDVEDLANYSIASAYGNTFRVVYMYPDQVVVQIGADRTKIDGFFTAAAAAGFLSGAVNIAMPLTNKTLTGFTILRDRMFRPVVQEQILTSGACLLQPVAGGGNVVWGRTTTISSAPEEQEISIVFIRDQIARSARAATANFPGMAETPTLQASIFAKINSMLQGMIGKLIKTYRNIIVIRDVTNPTQWNVSCEVQPLYPVNFVVIEFGIGILN